MKKTFYDVRRHGNRAAILLRPIIIVMALTRDNVIISNGPARTFLTILWWCGSGDGRVWGCQPGQATVGQRGKC